MKKFISIILSLILISSVIALPTSANAKGNWQESTNPVIDGFYSDPDIDYFDHKYWIFPTTDGVNGEYRGEGVDMAWWGNHTFRAFSSEDMVNWKNEGVIFDVKADTAEEAGVNEFGVQIGYSPWIDDFAWAPSIEKIGDHYFFFYVGRIKESLMSKYAYWIEDENRYLDAMAIGVAVADSPTGPYVAYDEPLFYGKQVAEYIFSYNDRYAAEYTIPSVIDPSVFVDTGVDANKDGQDDIYISFGNWTPMLARVKVDGSGITIDDSVFKPIKGILWGWWQPDDNGFMESIVIFKRNRTYYYTWSVAGTANIGYRVAYGTSNKITNEVNYKGTLLQLDPENGIYGTAHQSVLCNPIDNKVYICYHRLHNSKEHPLDNIAPDGGVDYRGCDRETCIDEIKFDTSGNAFAKPTHEGVAPVSVHNFTLAGTTMPNCTEGGKHLYKCSECEATKSETYTEPNGHSYKMVSDTATCDTDGTKTYQCITCSDICTEVSVKTHHSYALISDSATCTDDGIKTYECTKCFATKTEFSQYTGHRYEESVKRYNNCAKSDEEIRICRKCNLTQVSPITPIKKHVYTSKVTKKPTSSATGTMTYSCKNCSYKYTKSIAKLGKPTISKLTAKSKSFTASWKKVSADTGYQVQYSTSSKFTSPKTVTITKNSTLSTTVKKLNGKKKYYVRIRSYRTINGTKYYSSWSSAKAVTTKK